MEGTCRGKKVVSVCVFLVCLSALASAVSQENKNNQSMELTWTIGDFHAEKGEYI